MAAFPATYVNETRVTCDVGMKGIGAPAALPVFVTPRAKPLSGRSAIQDYVDAVRKAGSADLIIGAPAPQLNTCQFDQTMLRVRECVCNITTRFIY